MVQDFAGVAGAPSSQSCSGAAFTFFLLFATTSPGTE